MKSKIFCICAAIFTAALMLACGENAGQNQSTISVFGTGTVFVKPDMVQMSITLSKTAQTTEEAQREVSQMVGRALEILKNSGIEDKNVTTASLAFNSEYEYEYGSNRRVLAGQKAEQRIAFSVEGIDSGDGRISQIIDRLIQINGIELNQINFDLKNNTAHFTRSRELAFQKAREKAAQYAELSGLKMVKVLSITEEGNPQVLPMTSNRMVNQASFAAEAQSDTASTIIPSGEMEITTRILAVFLLE